MKPREDGSLFASTIDPFHYGFCCSFHFPTHYQSLFRIILSCFATSICLRKHIPIQMIVITSCGLELPPHLRSSRDSVPGPHSAISLGGVRTDPVGRTCEIIVQRHTNAYTHTHTRPHMYNARRQIQQRVAIKRRDLKEKRFYKRHKKGISE